MSPPSGDAPSSTDSSRQGGIANVLRGLTSSKFSKSSPTIASPSSSAPVTTAEFVHTPGHVPGCLSQSQMESLELLRNGSLSERVAAVNSLRSATAEYPLGPVLDIWYAAKDLIDPLKPASARIAGWELLTECVKHESSTDLERQEYFTTLSALANPDDFDFQLTALMDLTRRGRVLTGFDYDLIPLLTQWLRNIYKAVRTGRPRVSHASKGPRNSNKSVANMSADEKNLSRLFAFLMDVMKFSFNNADRAAVAGLIEMLLYICVTTREEEDLKSSIAVLDTIVTFGSIPDEKLDGCVRVLGSIYDIVGSLRKTAWHTLANLLKSHNGQATVRLLLDILRKSSAEGNAPRHTDTNREIRGALAVLQKLVSKSAEKGYPAVPYALLADGLSTIARTTLSLRTYSAALQLINGLFNDGHGNLHRLIVDEDWTVILEFACECAKKIDPEHRDSDKLRLNAKDDRPEDVVLRELSLLIARLDGLLNQKLDFFVPRQSVIRFLTEVHQFLPDATAASLLDYFQEFRCCSPSDLYWQDNLAFVLDSFFGNRNRSSQIRLRALETIMDAYEIVDLVGDDPEQSFIPQLAKSVLQDVAEETDVLVLEAIMKLMVSVISSCDMELFAYIIDALRGIVLRDRLKSPISASVSPIPFASPPPDESDATPEQSPSNVVAKGYATMFVQVMNFDSAKSIQLYNALVSIAKSSPCEVDARLTSMKILFRLRADWANRIFITKVLETNFLAPSICRTEESLARRQAEEAAQALRLSKSDHGGSSRPSRGISLGQAQASERGLPIRTPSGMGLKSNSRYRQIWQLPDPNALPDGVTGLFSPVLVSHMTEVSEADSVDADHDMTAELAEYRTAALNMSNWLEALLTLLNGCDWEVYSFVLVHLPSQLSNHAIFRDCIPQIQELRRVICEHLRTNSFQEPPNALGLRRADVAICLFHSLTMILSYHDHFQKGEEDEIVKTFVHGITHWERSARICIHALSICCHELPLSTSKSLIQLLTKMSTIITQPHVSVHILEFLACLSRQHHIYVNFREEEYKIVFGICFRYLQSVRDKKDSNRSSHASDPSGLSGINWNPADPMPQQTGNDDLPQYVYALAYHVILFWFMALKLPDRATLVAGIVKNLFVDAEEAHTDNELALTTIDFMQRVTYADIDESFEDARFADDRFGEVLKRHWVIGHSLVTVTQSTTTGWARVMKRQPSGTSAYTVKEALRPPPPHQIRNYVDVSRQGQATTNAILPSHLLVQLMSSLPQSHELGRPVPIPDEEFVDRAIRMLDHSPTVDGHKVGVIYIGEGQTDEAEILANVSGSSDYVEFLNNLGTLTRLKNATFNTHGLDREFDSDGRYTFCWRDRVTEIVFHVTTQMPTNLEHDPRGTLKKRHIGNDFVNIVFNDSGLPFKFDTFPGDFNYVHIVITPASRASFIATRDPALKDQQGQPFYRVQVMSKPGFPEISPASETKMVSLKALPGLIRLLALNASVFSHVWANRDVGEHVSSWRNRLRGIHRLRDKYVGKSAGSTLSSSQQPSSLGGPGAQAGEAPASRPNSTVRDSFSSSLRRTSVATYFTGTSEQTSHRSSTLSNATTNDTEVGTSHGLDSMVDSVDYSKWA